VKTFWLIMAGACSAVAAVFLLRADFDSALMAAVIGMVAWFLNYRRQAKAFVAAIDSEQEDGTEDLNDDQ
jgi:hypothetical protein